MEDIGIDGLAPVTVVRNGEIRAAGRRLDDVVVYDWGFQLNKRHHEQRSYVLLDDGFQINQPVIFPAAQQGWWYCDLVRVSGTETEIVVDDLWIDVIVGPPDHPYRVLDLDEYAVATENGALTPAEAADGLIRTQRFLDRRLNRRHETLRTWPDFPPQTVTTLAALPFERRWTRLTGLPKST
jgi:predicted RNA-binding protein associated with RNAse of E/G family